MESWEGAVLEGTPRATASLMSLSRSRSALVLRGNRRKQSMVGTYSRYSVLAWRSTEPYLPAFSSLLWRCLSLCRSYLSSSLFLASPTSSSVRQVQIYSEYIRGMAYKHRKERHTYVYTYWKRELIALSRAKARMISKIYIRTYCTYTVYVHVCNYIESFNIGTAS